MQKGEFDTNSESYTRGTMEIEPNGGEGYLPQNDTGKGDRQQYNREDGGQS